MKYPEYTRVASVPEGLTWKPSKGKPSRTHVTMYSIGNLYKLVRILETGEVTYYASAEALNDKGKSPAEKIDAEPERKKQQRFRVGAFCWYVADTGAWFACEVMKRTGENRETFGERKTITLRPTTGYDAERKVPWPFDGDLEIPCASKAFQRIKKLKDRQA